MAENINYVVTATDAGASATFHKVAEAARKSTSVFDSLKAQFGRGSTLKETAELLAGGGVVAGFSMIGNSLARMTEKLVEFKNAMNEGKKSAAELTGELLRGLPIIGGFAAAGSAIRELFTGEAAELARLTEENARATAMWEKHARAVERVQDLTRGFKLDPELVELDRAIREAELQGNMVAAKSLRQMQPRLASLLLERDFQRLSMNYRPPAESDEEKRLREWREFRDERDRQSRRDAWEARLRRSREAEDQRRSFGESAIDAWQNRIKQIGEQIDTMRSISPASRGGTLSTEFGIAAGQLAMARTDRGAIRDPRLDLERQALEEQKKIREHIESIRMWIDRGAMDQTPIPVLNGV